MTKESKIRAFIEDLMPGRSEVDIQEAEENFREYLLVIKDVAERLEREGKEVVTLDEGEYLEEETFICTGCCPPL